MIYRIFFTILFFLSTFIFPWYATVCFALLLLAVAPGYEIIMGGLILDFTYGTIVPDFFTSPFSFTIFFTLMFIVSYILKKHLVFYQDDKR